MNGFLKLLWQIPQMNEIMAAIDLKTLPMTITGLSDIHKAHFAAALSEKFNKPALIITADEASGKKICEDIDFMLGEGSSALYPVRDLNFRKTDSTSKEFEHLRLSVLGKILDKRVKIVVASAAGASQLTIPPDVLRERTFVIDSNNQYKLSELRERLIKCGYVARPQVDGISQFSIRGGIADIYSPHEKAPVRIEFWGDDVDSMSYFDLDTQRRTEAVSRCEILPASETLATSDDALKEIISKFIAQTKNKDIKENLQNDIKTIDAGLELTDIDKYLPFIYEKRATLFDYFEDGFLFVSNVVSVKDAIKGFIGVQNEDIKLLYNDGVMSKGMEGYSLDFAEMAGAFEKAGAVYLETFGRTVPEIRQKSLFNITATSFSGFSGELKYLIEDVAENTERKNTCVIFAGTEKGASNLAADLNAAGISAEYFAEIPDKIPQTVVVTSGTLSSGFEYPQGKVTVFTHSKNLNVKRKPKQKKKAEEMIRSLADLTVGDYVVHISHGIGIFDGIHKLDLHGVIKDYIKIKYAKGDILYVPVTQLDLVSKYIGPRDDMNIKLNKLNSSEWSTTKKKVKTAVAEMADELIKLYAERAKAKGYAFSEDNDWQKNFEERFEYEETDDQLRCIDEIKHDMQKEQPMERLLCGDVGFGKTEVAFRGAFKCVMDSKQCAILVPTTILAWQHYQTALARFENFPIKIELLSRFRTPKQQEKILAQLARGEIDIIIGTHRLVQNDVRFKDLGLVIIDEEQRFGVAHKEKFKESFSGVDMLTLSATPIPRTLNMAMSGIRDMSVIEEAPQNRHPVQTYVLEQDMGIIAEAIKKELRRGGQVYYLHNRVETIELAAAKLKNLIPDLRVEVAHGKMTEEQLSKVWQRLVDNEIDVLCCTTIIETGVDVSNVNTLIIEDADRLGLSQLYQLRGRVGRSSRRAFAYFMFTGGKVLTEVASKRLTAIREFTKFGSGFNIAMRDLEIRGAGNILGARQHGHMQSVGYDMYLRLLSDAVNEKKGDAKNDQTYECLVDIRVGAHIPEEYIENLAQRLDVYRKIASIRNNEDAEDIIDELIDRFGEMPPSVYGLIDVAVVRNMAARQGITEITEQNGALLFYFENINMQKVSVLAAEMRGRVLVNAGAKPYVSVKPQKAEKPVDTMKSVIAILNKSDV